MRGQHQEKSENTRNMQPSSGFKCISSLPKKKKKVSKGLHNAAFSEHRMEEASRHKLLLLCDGRGKF